MMIFITHNVSKPNTKRGNGFTIIEVVVTIAIFSLIMYSTLALLSGIFSMTSKQSSALGSVDQARKITFGITNELRKSSSANGGAFSLSSTGAQELIFYSNIDDDVLIERLRYFMDGTELRRGVIKPTGSPLIYNSANEEVNVVQANVANEGNPLFYYYDGTYDGTADNFLTQPVNINEIRHIKIKLLVSNTIGLSDTSTFEVVAGVTIRNLKDNLAD